MDIVGDPHGAHSDGSQHMAADNFQTHISEGGEDFRKEKQSVSTKFQNDIKTDMSPTKSRDIKTPEPKSEVDTKYGSSQPKSDTIGTPFLRTPDRRDRPTVPGLTGFDSIDRTDMSGTPPASEQSNSRNSNSSSPPTPEPRGVHHSEETDRDTENESHSHLMSGVMAAATPQRNKKRVREKSYVPGRLIYLIRHATRSNHI